MSIASQCVLKESIPMVMVTVRLHTHGHGDGEAAANDKHNEALHPSKLTGRLVCC